MRQAEVAGAWASFPPACSAEVALWQPAQAASPSLVPSHGALSLFTGHWVQAAALPCLIVLVLVNTLPLPLCLTPLTALGSPHECLLLDEQDVSIQVINLPTKAITALQSCSSATLALL